jgi:hypothetical protein
MAANTTIAVTSLDFDEIVTSINDYISSSTEFRDYNFSGSTISMLVRILAYNTYQNAFYVSMTGNEMFLDSAQLRASVVSRAKMLGYTPTSARSAYTTMSITYSSTNVFETVPRGSTFTVTAVDGTSLRFVTQDAYTLYSAEGYARDIVVYEGYDLTEKFDVSTSAPIKYVLSNANVDTTSIVVNVRASEGSSTLTRYVLANNIDEVTNTSNVYFLQEVQDGLFELYFGDGILGTALADGNVVEVTYRVTDGVVANDILTNADWAAVDSNITITAVDLITSGGTVVETIDSIKFNAPKSYETQNRAVVANDYERLILRENGNLIETLRVWGGENNVPPVYGKVFISAQPSGVATVLSSSQKTLVRNNIKQYNTLSIDVEFVDPSYIYIIPTINVYFDSSRTSLTAGGVASVVASTIQTYETNKLGKFSNDRFRFSEFVRTIDAADQSITYNVTSFTLQKRFNPTLNSKTKYTINFGKSLINKTGVSTLTSTSFTYDGQSQSFLDDDSAGNVRIYYVNNLGNIVYVQNNVGTIDYDTGVIILNEFGPSATPTSSGEISVTVIPNGYDLIVDKYLLMLFGLTVVNVIDETGVKISSAITVDTTGSVTQINEVPIGTFV